MKDLFAAAVVDEFERAATTLLAGDRVLQLAPTRRPGKWTVRCAPLDVTLGVDNDASLSLQIAVASSTPAFSHSYQLHHPSVFQHAASQLKQRIHALVRPIESELWDAQVKRALLVAKPIQIAKHAASQGTGALQWVRELTHACLAVLDSHADGGVKLTRQLFFQLLAVETCLPERRVFELTRYQQLGLCLAALRRHNPSLPFNPLLVYSRVLAGQVNPTAIMWGEEPSQQFAPAYGCRELTRKRLDWFLNVATLEQVVQALDIL